MKALGSIAAIVTIVAALIAGLMWFDNVYLRKDLHGISQEKIQQQILEQREEHIQLQQEYYSDQLEKTPDNVWLKRQIDKGRSRLDGVQEKLRRIE